MNNVLNLMLLSAIISIIFLTNHYLSFLLAIEFLMLMLLMHSGNLIQVSSKEINFIFLFMAMMIMEGIFGLALLVLASQSYGKDSVMMMQ